MMSNKKIFQQNIDQGKWTTEKEDKQKVLTQELSNSKPTYKWNIVWKNVIVFIYFHLGGIYGFYLWTTNRTKIYTILWCKYKYFNLFYVNYWISKSKFFKFCELEILLN